mmetsp:Transcript_29919/g.92486  ORF Transcript_29919/g.92486 Transcript_29919/m.92486 type:complete len:338 (+) Transcript_29919:3115-4128(+)
MSTAYAARDPVSTEISTSQRPVSARDVRVWARRCRLADDAVLALAGGFSGLRDVRLGRLEATWPPCDEIWSNRGRDDEATVARLTRGLKISIKVSSLEIHQSPVPRYMSKRAAAELLTPLFGDPDVPWTPTEYGWVARLLDGMDLEIDEVSFHQHAHEAVLVASTPQDARAVLLWNRALGTGSRRIVTASSVVLANDGDDSDEGDDQVAVDRRVAFKNLRVVDIDRDGEKIPYVRGFDGDIRVAATRRRSDGAISGMRVDALAPTEDASIYLVLARLPVSTIISVRLTVGNDAAAPRTGVTVGVTPPTMRSRRGESRVPRDARAVRVAPDSHGLPPQ